MSSLNMMTMTRVGQVALDRLGDSPTSIADARLARLQAGPADGLPLPGGQRVLDGRLGLGGNAMPGQEVLRARIASTLGPRTGHHAHPGVESPDGQVTYVPRLPEPVRQDQLRDDAPTRTLRGWRIWTVGDDIA